MTAELGAWVAIILGALAIGGQLFQAFRKRYARSGSVELDSAGRAVAVLDQVLDQLSIAQVEIAKLRLQVTELQGELAILRRGV